MTVVASTGGSLRASGRYQAWLVFLLSLNFGILFFDRNALNFLMPFIQPDLGLNNTQVGMLSSALALTWAIAGFFVGNYSDRVGKRKLILVIATIAFCLCSVLSGVAHSFLMLLGARLLMGAAEGGVLPVSHAKVIAEVEPKRRGLAAGFIQNVGSEVLGTAIAPLVLVPIALAVGWRAGFFVAAIPGLITAGLIWFTLREPPKQVREDQSTIPIKDALLSRNVILCLIMSVLMVSFLVNLFTFMPLHLTNANGFSPQKMGWLMAVLGFSATFFGFVVPAISDSVGRKPIFIISCLCAVALPLSPLYLGGQVVLLAVCFAIGWGVVGIYPLFMSTVPAESVDPRLAATLTGIVMGVGEVVGGVGGPLLAGAAADIWGLSAPLWIMACCAIISFILSFFLKESAPRVLNR